MEEKFIKLSSLFEYLNSREDYWKERVKPHIEEMGDEEYGAFHRQCVREDNMALGEVKELNNMSSSTICAYQNLKLYKED